MPCLRSRLQRTCSDRAGPVPLREMLEEVKAGPGGNSGRASGEESEVLIPYLATKLPIGARVSPDIGDCVAAEENLRRCAPPLPAGEHEPGEIPSFQTRLVRYLGLALNDGEQRVELLGAEHVARGEQPSAAARVL